MSLLAAVDLNWLLQFIVTVFILAFGFLHLVKNTASRYFLAEENDHDTYEVSDWSNPTAATMTAAAAGKSRSESVMISTTTTAMRGVAAEEDACAVCGNRTKKKCSRCKMVMYCSEACQRSHWKSEHKAKCKDFQLSSKSTLEERKASAGSLKIVKRTKEILFPYEEFLDFFKWDKPGFPPCGLINCGNSCFANVVLQCLAHTKPLVAFLLEKGHRRECRRNDWCFLCEFQTHVERASQSSHPFSPINILSRLPNIGGNLGYGKQEDAHEFMRFAIDTMQSVCLDEFGGEKAVHPSSQETTLIQHIFGGHLQSQVICMKCNNISNQFENMMDLTVEIHGDAASLEECLDQFTAKERLHGDNMYKCDGCNDYVMAWKRLAVRRPPNILTIALKRFQSGRFGKLNKRVTFPETLDLSPYMSEAGEDNNLYKLYAVIVHVDMLNASFFGHYICYVKDFCGKWYRIDDCKVNHVDLDDVLSQGAYMLLYSRIYARPSSLYPVEPLRKDEEPNTKAAKEVQPSPIPPVQCRTNEEFTDALVHSNSLQSDFISESNVASCEGISSKSNSEDVKEDFEMVDCRDPVPMDVEICAGECFVPPHKATAPFGRVNEFDPRNDSLTRLHSTETDSLKVELPSSSPDVDSVTGCTTEMSREHTVRHSLDEGSVASWNRVKEKEEMPVDAPATSSSCVVLSPKKGSNCGEKIRKAGCEDLPSSSIVQDSAGKLDGRRSGAKLKPLFAAGFLEKRSQNKGTKRQGEVSAELCEQESSGNMSCQNNGDAKPEISYHSDAMINVVKAHNCHNYDTSPVKILDEHVGLCEKETGMVIDAAAESAVFANGDFQHPTVLDEGTIVANTDDGACGREKCYH